MKTKRNTLVIISISISVLFVLVAVVSGGGAGKGKVKDKVAKAPQETEDCRNRQSSYLLHYKTKGGKDPRFKGATGNVQGPPLLTKIPDGQWDFQGTLRLSCLENGPRKTVFFLQFDEALFSLTTNGRKLELPALIPFLKTGFLVNLDGTGLITSIQMNQTARQLSLLEQQLVWSLGAALSFSRKAPGGEKDEWEVTEDTFDYYFRTRVSREIWKGQDKTKLKRKRISAISKLNQVGDMDVAITESDGECEFSPSLFLFPTACKARDRMNFRWKGRSFAWSLAQFSLVMKGKQVTLAVLPSPHKETFTIKPKTEEDIDLIIARNTLKGVSWADLKNQLDHFTPTKAAKRARFLEHLRAYSLVYPEKTKELGELLFNQEVDDKYRLVVVALESAGNPESQKAIVEAIRHWSGDWSHLKNLLPSAAFIRKPEPFLEEALLSLTGSEDDRIASTSLLVLGGVLGHISPDQTDRAARIKEEIVSRLSQGEKAADTKLAILALGNAGLRETTEILKNHLTSPDDQIRAAAVEALRFVPTVEAHRKMLEMAAHDPHLRVQEGAWQALRQHSPTDLALKVLDSEMRKAKDPSLKLSLIELCSSWGSRRPREIRDSLQYLVAHEASGDVKVAAMRILESL